jgi:hypothetical protein
MIVMVLAYMLVVGMMVDMMDSMMVVDSFHMMMALIGSHLSMMMMDSLSHNDHLIHSLSHNDHLIHNLSHNDHLIHNLSHNDHLMGRLVIHMIFAAHIRTMVLMVVGKFLADKLASHMIFVCCIDYYHSLTLACNCPFVDILHNYHCQRNFGYKYLYWHNLMIVMSHMNLNRHYKSYLVVNNFDSTLSHHIDIEPEPSRLKRPKQ